MNILIEIFDIFRIQYELLIKKSKSVLKEDMNKFWMNHLFKSIKIHKLNVFIPLLYKIWSSDLQGLGAC